MDDDNDDYRAEFGYRDRTGGDIEEGDFFAARGRFGAKDFDPKSRFVAYLGVALKNLQQQGVVKLTPEERGDLSRRARRLPLPQYKNASGVVLGYHATEGGRRLDQIRFKRAAAHLPFADAGLNIDDLARYCRMWLTGAA